MKPLDSLLYPQPPTTAPYRNSIRTLTPGFFIRPIQTRIFHDPVHVINPVCLIIDLITLMFS
jgi:hypothetical protein